MLHKIRSIPATKPALTPVREVLPLSPGSRAPGSVDMLKPAGVRIEDGLCGAGSWIGEGSAAGSHPVCGCHGVAPPPGAEILALPLPHFENPEVRTAQPPLPGTVRDIPPAVRLRPVRRCTLLDHGHLSPVRSGMRWMLRRSPFVHNGYAAVAALPQARTGMGPDRLPEEDRETLLREAERLRGLSPDQAEILAVFPGVPIEVVSALRYDEERRLLHMLLLEDLPSPRIRLYDLAALRNRETGSVHFVAHPARCRTIRLG